MLCWSAFPLVPALGSTASAAGTPALFDGFSSYHGGVRTSPDRASAATAPHLPAADHLAQGAYGRPRDLPAPAQGACGHARKPRPRRAIQTPRAGASEHVAFRYTDSVGAFGISFLSRLNGIGLPIPLPTLSPTSSRTPRARLGADVGRYSFIAEDRMRFRVKWSGSSAHQKLRWLFGIQGLSPISATWLVPHQIKLIRSPLKAVAPISRVRRMGLRSRSRPFFHWLFKPVLCSV